MHIWNNHIHANAHFVLLPASMRVTFFDCQVPTPSHHARIRGNNFQKQIWTSRTSNALCMTQHMEVLQWCVSVNVILLLRWLASKKKNSQKEPPQWNPVDDVCFSLLVLVHGVIESIHLHITLWWPNPWMVNAQIIGIGDTLLSWPKVHTDHEVFQTSQHIVHIDIFHMHLDCSQPFITKAIAELNENRPTQRTQVLPPSH